MTAEQLAQALTTIADKAPVLRAAGVVGRVTVEGFISFELGEPLTAAPATSPTLDGAHGNALDDGDTFGGHIPRRRIPDGPQPTTEDDEE